MRHALDSAHVAHDPNASATKAVFAQGTVEATIGAVNAPTGETTCVLDDAGAVNSAALLRTTRKLMDGAIFE